MADCLLFVRLLPSDTSCISRDRSWPDLLHTPERATAMSPEQAAAYLVEMSGARPCATAHVRATPALLYPPFVPLPWWRKAPLTHQRTQQNVESVLRDSQLALRYRRETPQQIGPFRHRNRCSLNCRQNLAKRFVNRAGKLLQTASATGTVPAKTAKGWLCDRGSRLPSSQAASAGAWRLGSRTLVRLSLYSSNCQHGRSLLGQRMESGFNCDHPSLGQQPLFSISKLLIRELASLVQSYQPVEVLHPHSGSLGRRSTQTSQTDRMW